MIKDYEIVGKNVLVTDDQGEHLRENVDNIDEILKAENYIEYLEMALVKCIDRSNGISIISNRTFVLHTTFKVLFGVGITALVALIINLIQFGGTDSIANTIFGPMSTRLFQILGVEAILSPAFGFYINMCYHNHKDALGESEKYRKRIDFLKVKISEEKRNLEVLEMRSKMSDMARTPSLSMESYNEKVLELIDKQLIAASYGSGYTGRQTEVPEEETTLESRPYVMSPKKDGGRL